jgi:hypothetical protein
MAESARHLGLVRLLIWSMERKNLAIRSAAVPEFSRPPAVFGYEPDVIAASRDALFVGEVECGDSLDSAHTRAQMRAFVAFARAARFRCIVVLYVPSKDRERARQMLMRAGIQPHLVRLVSPRIARRRRPGAPMGTAPNRSLSQRAQADHNARARRLALRQVQRGS